MHATPASGGALTRPTFAPPCIRVGQHDFGTLVKRLSFEDPVTCIDEEQELDRVALMRRAGGWGATCEKETEGANFESMLLVGDLHDVAGPQGLLAMLPVELGSRMLGPSGLDLSPVSPLPPPGLRFKMGHQQ